MPGVGESQPPSVGPLCDKVTHSGEQSSGRPVGLSTGFRLLLTIYGSAAPMERDINDLSCEDRDIRRAKALARDL